MSVFEERILDMQRIIFKDEEDIELTIEDAEDIEEWKECSNLKIRIGTFFFLLERFFFYDII